MQRHLGRPWMWGCGSQVLQLRCSPVCLFCPMIPGPIPVHQSPLPSSPVPASFLEVSQHRKKRILPRWSECQLNSPSSLRTSLPRAWPNTHLGEPSPGHWHNLYLHPNWHLLNLAEALVRVRMILRDPSNLGLTQLPPAPCVLPLHLLCLTTLCYPFLGHMPPASRTSSTPWPQFSFQVPFVKCGQTEGHIPQPGVTEATELGGHGHLLEHLTKESLKLHIGTRTLAGMCCKWDLAPISCLPGSLLPHSVWGEGRG